MAAGGSTCPVTIWLAPRMAALSPATGRAIRRFDGPAGGVFHRSRQNRCHPHPSLADRPARARSDNPSLTARSSTGSGPSATSCASRRSVRTRPLRSVMATITWGARTPTASTTRAAGLKTKRDGGLPPFEVASPRDLQARNGSVHRCGRHRGARQPGGPRQFCPVLALPSRRIWNRSPARDRAAAASGASAPAAAAVFRPAAEVVIQ